MILYKSRKDLNLFFIHEIWESKEGLALHNTKPYLLKFKEQTGTILSEVPEMDKAILIL